MAHHSMPGPDSDEAESPGDASANGSVRIGDGEFLSLQSDLAELTAKFSSKQGGALSPELSRDLALEIVLNEIVQLACASTGAGGAAVILQRDEDWVCRASSGAMAPELGAKVSPDSGLTAECINTRQALRCDDAETDPRADNEVCRSLGVRSMIVLPLAFGEELFGVLAAFSPDASAFRERNESVLQALSQCVIEKIAWTRHQDGSERIIHNESSGAESLSQTQANTQEFGQFEPVIESGRNRGMTAITWTMAAIVLLFVVVLTTLAGERLFGKTLFGSRRSSAARSDAKSQNNVSDPARTNAVASPTNSTASAPAAQLVGGNAAADAVKPAGAWATPSGGLTIYENGKEVFRQLPQPQPGTASPGSDNAATSVAGSVTGQQSIYEILPREAEKLLAHRVEPEYPEQARLQQIQGDVVLEIQAAPDGSVQNVSLVSGNPLLADAAIAATKQWRFKPYVVGGRAVEIQTRASLSFRLSK
jgi:TonB family protein